jgi:hypothetical protein
LLPIMQVNQTPWEQKYAAWLARVLAAVGKETR